MGVGAEIEALCGHCGTTWHVVIALVDGRAAQIECRRCGRRHKLRGGAAPRIAAPRRAGSRAAVASRPLVAPDPSRPVRPYRAGDVYAVAERIEHPTLGSGVVERVLGPGKIQVFFTGGSRVLAQARPGRHAP
jgi:hypothetical protein